MPIEITKQDITKIECDAIVCPTNSKLKDKEYVDNAIRKAAGRKLARARRKIKPIDVGEAKITQGYLLPAKYVIHTVGPTWQGGNKNERELLESCYVKSFNLAKEQGCESIAFPLISSGSYDYPKDEILKIALYTLEKLLHDTEMMIYLVVCDKYSFSISESLNRAVSSFIGEYYVDMEDFQRMGGDRSPFPCLQQDKEFNDIVCCEKSVPSHDDMLFSLGINSFPEFDSCDCLIADAHKSDDSLAALDDFIKNMDKGFAQTLFSYIDSKGIDDVECYKNANVDKKTFSKIKCVKDYKPSKKTVVSFAIALRLNIDEAEHLLKTAGFALSRNNLFDVIIEYFISTGNYKSIWDVNEVLYKFDQATLV